MVTGPADFETYKSENLSYFIWTERVYNFRAGNESEKWLLHALVCNHFDVAIYLAESGYYPTQYGNFAFRYAIEYGHLNMAVYFLEVHGTPKSKSRYHKNTIPIAAELGHLPIVKYLTEKGWDPTVYDNQAIRDASSHGHIDVVRYLFEYGCNPNTCGGEALRLSTLRGYLPVAKYLSKLEQHPAVNNPHIDSWHPADKKEKIKNYFTRWGERIKSELKLVATLTDKFDIYKGALCDLIEMI
jgi:hypothetical protein